MELTTYLCFLLGFYDLINRKWGCKTKKGKTNAYASHSGTFTQVQETYVNVVTGLFNRKWTTYLLLGTEDLCEILNL